MAEAPWEQGVKKQTILPLLPPTDLSRSLPPSSLALASLPPFLSPSVAPSWSISGSSLRIARHTERGGCTEAPQAFRRGEHMGRVGFDPRSFFPWDDRHPCLILRAMSLSLQGAPANIGKG
jgi:hypothetical protein